MNKVVFAKGLSKLPRALLAAVLLLAFVPTVQAYAESREAQVRYEVSATIVIIDGESQTVQKVPVGTILGEPQPRGSAGGAFIGWMDRETGSFWDFATPVNADLTLVACYELEGPAGKEQGTESVNWIEAAPLANTEGAGKPRALQKTGDHASWPFAFAAASLALLVAVRVGRKRFRR